MWPEISSTFWWSHTYQTSQRISTKLPFSIDQPTKRVLTCSFSLHKLAMDSRSRDLIVSLLRLAFSGLDCVLVELLSCKVCRVSEIRIKAEDSKVDVCETVKQEKILWPWTVCSHLHKKEKTLTFACAGWRLGCVRIWLLNEPKHGAHVIKGGEIFILYIILSSVFSFCLTFLQGKVTLLDWPVCTSLLVQGNSCAIFNNYRKRTAKAARHGNMSAHSIFNQWCCSHFVLTGGMSTQFSNHYTSNVPVWSPFPAVVLPARIPSGVSAPGVCASLSCRRDTPCPPCTGRIYKGQCITLSVWNQHTNFAVLSSGYLRSVQYLVRLSGPK